jgi:hypothetical protein
MKYSSRVAVTDDIDGEGASGWGAVMTGSAGDIDAVGVMSNVKSIARVGTATSISCYIMMVPNTKESPICM